MGKIIRKNQGFFYWVFLPSVLLVAAVFGVNLIPRPAISLYGSSFSCPSDGDAICNSNPTNICVQEFCNSAAVICDIASYDTGAAPVCADCFTCGNGRCEMAAGEGQFIIDTSSNVIVQTCPEDCLTDNFDHQGPFQGTNGGGNDGAVDDFVCMNYASPGGPPGTTIELVGCGEDLQNTASLSTAPVLDGCCPAGCQGVDSNDTQFDGDCCATSCGDGTVDTGEECEPGVADPACPAGETCNATTCLCEILTATPIPTPLGGVPNIEGSGCSLQRGAQELSTVVRLSFLLSFGAAFGAFALLRRRSA
jgi:hypothetical protein